MLAKRLFLVKIEEGLRKKSRKVSKKPKGRTFGFFLYFLREWKNVFPPLGLEIRVDHSKCGPTSIKIHDLFKIYKSGRLTVFWEEKKLATVKFCFLKKAPIKTNEPWIKDENTLPVSLCLKYE